MKHPVTTAFLSALLAVQSHGEGGVSVATGGTSNGAGLNSFDGPKKINRLAKSKASGGSITTARARAIFTRTDVTIGNEVIARNGITGDQFPTHVDANSIFVGVGTFKANKRGARVRDFTLNVTVHGTLECRIPDPNIPEGFAIAGVGVDFLANGRNLLSGTAFQDGAGPFRASGNLGGSFRTLPNKATINRTFPVNLGTLRDGQRVPVLFLGTTLVSFGADVPVDFAKADFYRTSTFTPAKTKKGEFSVRHAGKSVDVAYEFVPDPIPENVLSVESADDSVINNIDPKKVFVAVPAVGYYQDVPTVFEATPGTPGDLDNDGTPDVRLTIDNPSFDQVISGSNTVIVYGLTTSGEAFSGTLQLQ